ncbi:MAG: hypothetical protein MHMPM18_004420, partial [Marteilia pararefringens]
QILGGIIRAKYYPDLEELEGLYADEGSASRQAQTGRSTASMTNSVRVNSCKIESFRVTTHHLSQYILILIFLLIFNLARNYGPKT